MPRGECKECNGPRGVFDNIELDHERREYRVAGRMNRAFLCVSLDLRNIPYRDHLARQLAGFSLCLLLGHPVLLRLNGKYRPFSLPLADQPMWAVT